MVTIPKVVLKPKVMQKVQPKRNILLKLKVGKLKYMKKKKKFEHNKKPVNAYKAYQYSKCLPNPIGRQVQIARKIKMATKLKWLPNQNGRQIQKWPQI